MKKSLVSIMLLFLTVFSFGIFANISTPSNGKNVNVLFLQSSPKAELIPNETPAGTYNLVLHEVRKNVSYFSDRPDRISGTMPIIRFVKFWQEKGPDSFSVQAPNADMNGVEMHTIFSTQNANFVFALSKPTYNAKKHTMTYLATPLQGPQQKQLPNKPIKLEHVKLFFDNVAFCPSCNGPP